MVCDWRWWRHMPRITQQICTKTAQTAAIFVFVRRCTRTGACNAGIEPISLFSLKSVLRVNVCQHWWMACLSINKIRKRTTFDLSLPLIVYYYKNIIKTLDVRWHVDTVIDVHEGPLKLSWCRFWFIRCVRIWFCILDKNVWRTFQTNALFIKRPW